MADKEIKIGLTVTGDAKPIEDTAAALDDLQTKAVDTADNTRDMTDAMEETAEATRGTQRAVAALTIAQLAGQVSSLGQRMRSLADDIRSVDPALADAMDGWGNLASTAGNAASTIAMGFATGGPIGAAVGGLVAVINFAQGEMEEAAKDAQREIADSQKKTEKILQDVKARQEEASRAAAAATERMARQQSAAYDRVRASIEAAADAQERLLALQGKLDDSRDRRARSAIEASGMPVGDKINALTNLEMAAIERKYNQDAETKQVRINAMNDQLANAEREADAARDAAARANEALSKAIRDEDRYRDLEQTGNGASPEAGRLRQAYGGDPANKIEGLQAARDKANELADELSTGVEALANNLKNAVDTANAELEALAALADEEKAAVYEDAQRKLNDLLVKEGQEAATAASEMGATGSAFSEAMRRASQSLADGFQPADLDAFTADMRRVQGDMTASEQRTADMLRQMMMRLKERQDQQEAQIRQLSSQIR